MIQIVINYDPSSQSYKVYEPTTQNLIITQDLTEALVTLNLYLQSQGLIKEDILKTEDITYHLDAYTMKAIIESNVKLMKRLKSAPSAFQQSSQRFGTSLSSGTTKRKDKGASWGGESKRKFTNSKFEGATGFNNSHKKFYGKSRSKF